MHQSKFIFQNQIITTSIEKGDVTKASKKKVVKKRKVSNSPQAKKRTTKRTRIDWDKWEVRTMPGSPKIDPEFAGKAIFHFFGEDFIKLYSLPKEERDGILKE